MINLRTLRPLDYGTVIRSVTKTNRLVTVEEGWPQNGIGADISAVVTEEAFDHLDAPIERVSIIIYGFTVGSGRFYWGSFCVYGVLSLSFLSDVPTCSVRHCRNEKVYSPTTTAMHEIEYISPLCFPRPPPSVVRPRPCRIMSTPPSTLCQCSCVFPPIFVLSRIVFCFSV